MSPNKNDRPQSVKAFLNELNCDNWDLSNKQENQTSKTKPINKGTKPYTEPIKKKKKHSDDSKKPEKWNVSYWATLVALVISLISLWLVFPNIFFTGLICLAGLAIDFGLCHYMSKWIKKNSGLLFTISFFIFIIICYVVKFFLPVYIVIAEIVLLMIFLLAFVQEKNIIRWCTSAALLGTTCFFGYVWYSQNILHNIYSENNDSNIIEQTEIEDSEITNEVIEKNINGHDYVDLGLPSGLKWATCNMGASNPEDYGNYYAWGETSTKGNYDILNSVTHGKNRAELQSKDVINTYGNLLIKYDAASVNWGSNWRIPTVEDFKELKDNCTWKWTNQEGINGYRVTGQNGCSIFLPAAGFRDENHLYHVGDGTYWSAAISRDNKKACAIYFYEDHCSIDSIYDRFCGRSIRPVID